MWDKLVLLATLAGMTCLMRANIGEIVRAPGGKELGLAMLERNGAIAEAAGFPIADGMMRNYAKIFSDPENDFTASMLRDVERKGPVEADHIIGFMLEKARQYGIEPILHQVAYTHLKAYEERRKAGRA
jgi:2-dehydropantoate 2-reductase